MLDGELTHEELDENDSENFTDGDDAHILLKWGGGHNRMLREVKYFTKCDMTPPPIIEHKRVVHSLRRRPRYGTTGPTILSSYLFFLSRCT